LLLHLEQRTALGKMVRQQRRGCPAMTPRIKVLPGLPHLLGMQMTETTRERVTAILAVEEIHSNGSGFVHGGALMAFADTLGAAATALNLPAGSGTTTLESKTNFLRAGPLGATLVATATPIHRGRRTQVWQTRIETDEGKLVAVVTQTQMVLPPG
jgi:1,4-dihydroxy-2-naphthoyl-CoA hydrolase